MVWVHGCRGVSCGAEVCRVVSSGGRGDCELRRGRTVYVVNRPCIFTSRGPGRTPSLTDFPAEQLLHHLFPVVDVYPNCPAWWRGEG